MGDMLHSLARIADIDLIGSIFMVLIWVMLQLHTLTVGDIGIGSTFMV